MGINVFYMRFGFMIIALLVTKWKSDFHDDCFYDKCVFGQYKYVLQADRLV